MLIDIIIDKEIIQNSKRCNHKECLLAVATNKVLKEQYYASVGIKINIRDKRSKDGEVLSIKSLKILKLIDDFDQKKTIEPTIIRVDIPIEYLNYETIEKYQNIIEVVSKMP